jgi:hypothetical protein
MKQSDCVDVLVGGTDSAAAAAISHLRLHPLSAAGTLDLVERLAAAFASSSLLSKRAQAARYRLVLLALRLTDEQFLRITGAATHLPAHLRVTLAEIAPPQLQHRVYNVGGTAITPRRPMGQAPLAATPRTSPPADGLGDHRTDRTLLRRAHIPTPESSRRPVFVLISHADYQEPNRNILEKELDLDVVVADSLDRLASLLGNDLLICGFAIDESVLRPLEQEEQRALLTTLAEYSTFAPIRIHDVALLLSHGEVTNIVKECRRLRSPRCVTLFL